MIVGTLEIDLMIPGSESLKDKRQVMKSLVEQLRNRFNVSVAEVDHLQAWRRGAIGVACVANETAFVNKVLNKVLDAVGADPRVSIIDCQMEML